MRFPAIAAVVSMVLLAVDAQAAEKRVDRTFIVAPGGTLVVEADSASVHVTGSSGDKVVVHMLASSSEDDLAGMQLEATQSGNDVNVVMRRGRTAWFRSWHGNQEIRVSVPQRFGIKVKTGGGDVELANTTGNASLRTSGGDIVAKSVTGNVEADTSGGNISIDTVRGEVDADTSGGDVRLARVDGKMRGNTSGGDVEVDLVGTNRGIVASTSGGSIRLTLPRGTNANLEATTSGGGFTSDLPVSTTEFREGHVKGTLNGGGPSIDANTSGGDISVRAAN